MQNRHTEKETSNALLQNDSWNVPKRMMTIDVRASKETFFLLLLLGTLLYCFTLHSFSKKCQVALVCFLFPHSISLGRTV